MPSDAARLSAVTPVEIARQALHRLAELGLPPTPESFEAQYREIAGLSPRAQPQPPAPPAADTAMAAQTMDMLRKLLQFISSANAGLHADLTRFSDESGKRLAQVGNNRDAKNVSCGTGAMEKLFEAMTASATSLLGQVDKVRLELERTRQQLDQAHRELEEAQSEAVSDPLTGLPNRRALDAALSREIARARRNQAALCLALIDVDQFKRVNDKFGHAIGDAALVHLARVLKPVARETDLLARFGGEQFVLVLPDTPLVAAEATMNRLLSAIERAPLVFEGKLIEIRFSAGLTAWSSNDDVDHVMQRADEALHQAKAAGRGRVMVV